MPDSVRQLGIDFPLLLGTEGSAMRVWTPRVLPGPMFPGAGGRLHLMVVGAAFDRAGEEARSLLASLAG